MNNYQFTYKIKSNTMSSLQQDKSKKIVYNNLVQQSAAFANSVVLDQYDSRDHYGISVCGKKIKNKILIDNVEPKLVRPNRTTQNLKHRKKNDAKKSNKGLQQRYGQANQKSKQRPRSRSSSNSNLSWQKSLRSDKTEKKSSNRSPSFKLLGFNKMRSGQLSNSNSKSLSLIKSTSRSKHKSPSVSLKKKMEKETLKKNHKLHLKSTQLQKPKKTRRRSSGKRHQVNPFQIDQQNQHNRKNCTQNKQIKRYIENNSNKQSTNAQKKIKNDVIQKSRKKQRLQMFQTKRKWDQKISTQIVNVNKSRAKVKNSKEAAQDSNSSYMLSPIYHELKGKVVENEKPDRDRQKQNKKTNLKNLMKMQYVKGFQGSKQVHMERNGNFRQQDCKIEKQLLSKPRKSQSHNIFDKYMKGYATSRDYYWLVSAATKIQKVWRGFRDRKYFYQALKQAKSSYQSIHRSKDFKNQQFRFNDQSNSIIQIEKQFQADNEHRIKKVEWINSLIICNKQKRPQNISEVKTGFAKHPQSGQQYPKQLQNLMKKLHNKFTKPKFLEIPAINQNKSSNNSKNQEHIRNCKIKLIKQEGQKQQQQNQRISQLERRLKEGQQKYKHLQLQLYRMKSSIASVQPGQSEKSNDKPNRSNKQSSGNSNPLYFDEYQITSSRISNSNQKNSSQQFVTPRQSREVINQILNQNELPSGITGNCSSIIKISNYQQSEQHSQRGSQKSSQGFSQFKNKIEHFGKNMVDSASGQSFQQSLIHSMKPQQVFHSPRQGCQKQRNIISRKQERNLSSLSQHRISELFLKKQIKVDQLFEKKAFMFKNLLNQNILSPKTYENKIFMLRQSCSKEKCQIKTKIKQAQNVISYLKHIENQCFPQKMKIIKSQNQKADAKQVSISPIKHVDCYYSSPSPIKEFQRNDSQCSQHTPEGSKIKFQKSEKKSATKFISVQETKNTSAKKQGFDTSISFIKKFCIQLTNFTRIHDKNTLKKIHSPIDQDSFLMLQAYRTNQNLEHVSQYNVYANEMLYPFFRYAIDRYQIIDKQTFTEFLKSLQGNNSNSSSKKRQSVQDEEQSDDKILKLYFHEMLFDAFNQAMDYERPYGVKGKGFAWSKEIGKLVKESETNYDSKNWREAEMKMNEFFGNSIGRLMHWSQFLCGFFPQFAEDSSFNVTYDDNSQKQMRQKRMALMLQNSIVQGQQSMKDTEGQITETKLFLSQQVFNQLIEELVRQYVFKI